MDRPSHRQKIVLKLSLAAIIILALWPLASAAAARAGTDIDRYGNDFTVFYAAARNLLLQGDPYNHALAAHTPYLYPPLFALLLAPIVLLSLPSAALLWCWLNIIAAFFLIVLTTRLIAPSRPLLASALLAIMLARIILDNLFWGQVNIIVALLITGWLILRKESRHWWAAMLLAIAISIKITPALLIFYLVLKRRGAELARLALCLTAMTSISLLPLGRQAFPLLAGWFNRTILNGQGFNWAYAGNQSLRGAFLRALSASATEANYFPTANWLSLSPTTAQLIFAMAALALLIWLGAVIHKRAQYPIKEDFLYGAAAVCCLMLLLSNLSWKAHFIIMALPWAIMIKSTLDPNSSRRRINLLLLAGSLLLCGATIAPLIGARAHQWCEVHSCFCIAALVGFYAVISTRAASWEQPREPDFILAGAPVHSINSDLCRHHSD
jgi:alpha-1,2-mannosyltransferase